MRLPALVVNLSTLAALAAAPALGAERDGGPTDCTVHAGPDDLVSEDGDLTVPEGARAHQAVALHGSVRVKSGATVGKAVALGGSVTVESGAVVKGDAVALGGDVRLEGDARVGKDAVSLGGEVRQGPRAHLGGHAVGLALQVGGSDLARKVLDEIHAKGPCRVVTDGR